MLTAGAGVVQAATPVPITPAVLPAGIEALATYVPAVSCDVRDKPGSVALGRLLKATYPVSSFGVSRACPLSVSEHSEGRAVDWMSNSRIPAQNANATAVITWLLATDRAGNTYANARRLGVMYLIYNNKIWGAYRPGDGWRPYQGCDTPAKAGKGWDTACHRDHIHFSLSWEGAMGRTSFWSKRVAAADYGPCRAVGLNWAAAPAGANPRRCGSVPALRAEAGSSALHAGLVGASGLVMRRGSTGPVVALVQKLVGVVPADGQFGAGTEAKVRAYQRAVRVPASGVVDAGTWRAALKATAPRPAPKAVVKPAVVRATAVVVSRSVVRKPLVYKFRAYLNTVLRRGSRGAAVQVLQKAVGVRADGVFGSGTDAKVRAFQRAHRLPVTGVTAAAFWRAFG